jgi:dipeptidyl aminopeptidase/acylaminoacyl peptidase
LQRRSDLSTRFGLFGSSFGGAVCLWLARETEASALVVNAAPLRSRSLVDGEIIADGPAGLDASFYRENLQFDVSEALGAIRTICVFHGRSDRVVPVENGVEIYERAGDPKKITIFEGGDHRMSREADQRRFVREAAAWFCRHLLENTGTVAG